MPRLAKHLPTRVLLPGIPVRFRNLPGVRLYVARILHTLEQGYHGLSTDVARTMLGGAKLLGQLIEANQTQERLKILEGRLGIQSPSEDAFAGAGKSDESEIEKEGEEIQ
jgi:hypothetical protein